MNTAIYCGGERIAYRNQLKETGKKPQPSTLKSSLHEGNTFTRTNWQDRGDGSLKKRSGKEGESGDVWLFGRPKHDVKEESIEGGGVRQIDANVIEGGI